MFPFDFNEGVLVPLAIFAIPIVAITGGIVLGIVRSLGRQRMLELAARERIAAIERGIDPAKLAPLVADQPDIGGVLDAADRYHSPLRRAQGLLIGGLVTLFAGVGVCMFFGLLLRGHEGEDASVWAMGLIPAFVGVALLISSWIVWPRAGTPR